MASRTFDFDKPISEDTLQQLFRAVLRAFCTSNLAPRPIVTELASRKRDDDASSPLTQTSTWGSLQTGYRKTMVAQADAPTECYHTSLRYETYGLPNGILAEYEFRGQSPWTDPDCETGRGRLTVTADGAERLPELEVLVRGQLGL